MNKGRTFAMMLGAALALISIGCAGNTPPPTAVEVPRVPRVYDISGWGSAWVNTQTKEATAIDIYGEVGHPELRLTQQEYGPKSEMVDAPTAHCALCSNCEGMSWSAPVEIVSGTLPPGLAFDKHENIAGIPTERGHWIVTLKQPDINCQGRGYQTEFQQVLRFHITGTGEVHQNQ